MRILHYSLGFSPYRTGGMTKFCMDLLEQQIFDGHQTALIWPGRMGFFDQKVSIKSSEHGDIQSFEVCGPLPVPYDEGISQCHMFTRDSGRETYEKLLEVFRPDIIHMHTLMGMHQSFLEAAKERGIRCVFTTHDYFPICPKVTMVRHGQVCPSAMDHTDCAGCNRTALPVGKIKILQSVIYRNIKDHLLVCRLRKRHRDSFLKGDTGYKGSRGMGGTADYEMLRQHYFSFLKKMDVIHYSSTIAKTVYESFFHMPRSEVIGISHGDIKDYRKKKKFIPDRLRIAYLGPQGEAKGFFCSGRRLMSCGRRINGSVWISISDRRSCRLI